MPAPTSSGRRSPTTSRRSRHGPTAREPRCVRTGLGARGRGAAAHCRGRALHGREAPGRAGAGEHDRCARGRGRGRAEVGLDLTIEVVRGIRAIEGVGGVHLMGMGTTRRFERSWSAPGSSPVPPALEGDGMIEALSACLPSSRPRRVCRRPPRRSSTPPVEIVRAVERAAPGATPIVSSTIPATGS